MMTDPYSIDTEVELYLGLEATGVYDWRSFVPLRGEPVIIRRGQDDLADDPTPGQSELHIRDAAGNLNPENPMGLYYGSIDRGTPQRISIKRGEDAFTRSSASGWGGLWTNGLSSGGTVAATDWSVSSNAARHSVPAANARRTSDYDLGSQVQADAEARVTVTFPVSAATVASISTELWFRGDAGGLTSAQLILQPGGALHLGVYDIVDGVTSVRLSPIASGLTALSTQTFKFVAQVEGMTVRAKVWAATDPEPLSWMVSAHGVVVRPGWVSVSSFVSTGNTNTKPLVFVYDDFKIRLPLFCGEITDIRPSGDNLSGGVKKVKLQAHDILNRLMAPGAPEESSLRRARSRSRRWWYVGGPVATGGSSSTVMVSNTDGANIAIGDLLFVIANGLRKEDTQFRITDKTVGASTLLSLSPSGRSPFNIGDNLFIVRPGPTNGAPIGYWPMEEGSQSTVIESGLPNGAAGVVTIGTPEFGANSDIAVSEPILVLNGAELQFPIPPYSSTVFTVIAHFVFPETEDAAAGQNIMDVVLDNGTARYAAVTYLAGGSLRFYMADSASTILFQTEPIGFNLIGTAAQVTLQLKQVGSTVTYYLGVAKLDGSLSGPGGTVTGVTSLGTGRTARVNPGGGYDRVAVGHLTFVPDAWDLFTTYYDNTGWNNHAAIRRFLRICWEEGIDVSYWDNRDVVTAALGRQKISTVYQALVDVTNTDGGFLTGPKGALELNLRTRGSLYNQEPAFTLHGGSGGHIAEPFDPAFDFAETVNRVTVDRIDGTTVVREETSGRLSTAPPPAGIGRRERKFTISAGSDVLAGLLADEKINFGMLRGPRVKELNIRPMVRNSITVEQMADLSVGSLIEVDNLNTRNIYGTLSAIVVGYELQLQERHNPELKINCIRGEPFRAFALTGDDRARPDAFDTVMNSTVSTTQLTNFGIESTSDNYVWTSRASDFPILLDIAGEHVLVSAISAPAPGSTAQTLTVTQRSVNGVVKGHVPGHTVRLAKPNRAARR